MCFNLKFVSKRGSPLKADLHSANFSRANDTFRWRRLSFQSSLEANEIWIICKAKCFKQEANHMKSAEN